jgi:phosphoinositide-3-kinase, regulatory subunit 4
LTFETLPSGAMAFIASAVKKLPTTDVWCIVYPSLKHLLKSDIKDITEPSLLVAAKSAVSSPQHLFFHVPDTTSI